MFANDRRHLYALNLYPIVCQWFSKCPCPLHSSHLRWIARISALFREMIRKASVFESNISFAWRNSYNQTLHKLERELQAVCFPFPEGFLSERKNFSSDFQTFQDWDQKYDQKVKASGLRAWRKKLRISNAADKKLVHRWLKGSFATVPRLMQRSDGSLSGSVSEMLESVFRPYGKCIQSTHGMGYPFPDWIFSREVSGFNFSNVLRG